METEINILNELFCKKIKDFTDQDKVNLVIAGSKILNKRNDLCNDLMQKNFEAGRGGYKIIYGLDRPFNTKFEELRKIEKKHVRYIFSFFKKCLKSIKIDKEKNFFMRKLGILINAIWYVGKVQLKEIMQTTFPSSAHKPFKNSTKGNLIFNKPDVKFYKWEN